MDAHLQVHTSCGELTALTLPFSSALCVTLPLNSANSANCGVEQCALRKVGL